MYKEDFENRWYKGNSIWTEQQFWWTILVDRRRLTTYFKFLSIRSISSTRVLLNRVKLLKIALFVHILFAVFNEYTGLWDLAQQCTKRNSAIPVLSKCRRAYTLLDLTESYNGNLQRCYNDKPSSSDWKQALHGDTGKSRTGNIEQWHTAYILMIIADCEK